MAGKHFISVLGTGNYRKAAYQCEEGQVTTSYVQEAVLGLKMLGQEKYGEGNRVTILVTEAACQKNWLDRDYTDKELKDMGMEDAERPVRKTGLRSVLQKAYGIGDEAVCSIPIGATEQELWDIFNIIYDEIQEEEELYVDITHSLRNIPIQMLSVIAYARTLKKVKVNGIYYGAFEVGQKNEEGLTVAPIFNLITFLEILDWSQAAASFIEYGNSDEIKALYDSRLARIGGKDLKKIVNDLSDITQGLETSRGCYRTANQKTDLGVSVLKSYRSYEDTHEILRKKNEKAGIGQVSKNQMDPLSRLFDVINDKLKVFDVEDNLAFGYAAIEWAIKNRKTQQGFTALDETIKTYLCRRYGLDEYLERHREKICKAICNLFMIEMRLQEEDKSDFSEEEREVIFRKWKAEWERYCNGAGNGKAEEMPAMTQEEEQEAARKLVMELPCGLAKLGSEIANRRNAMNHFGYSNIYGFGCRGLYKDLGTYYEQFREMTARMEGDAGDLDGTGETEEESADS